MMSKTRDENYQGDNVKQKTIEILRRFNIRAKKKLGQNFLIDSDVLDRILAAAELGPQDIVLEVGPGLGILTQELVKRCRQLVAVEIDPHLVTMLRSLLSDSPNVAIVEKDILEIDPRLLLAQVLGRKPEEIASRSYKIVANLPYYITSLFLRHFLEAEAKPSIMVLAVQKEVAERITAKPGRLSLLGVSVQVYGRTSIVARVPAGSFLPKPQVDSAIVRIDVYERPAVDVDDLDAYFRVVQAGFRHPRKQLHNAIAQSIWLPPGKAQELLLQAGIDPSRRAQTLSLDEWVRVYEAVKKSREAEG